MPVEREQSPRRADVQAPSMVVAALVGLTLVAACGELPRPRLYQVEGAADLLGGRTRALLSAHRACQAAANDTEELVGCMREAGYEFIARGRDPQADDCWSLREGRREWPPTYCFVRRVEDSPPP